MKKKQTILLLVLFLFSKSFFKDKDSQIYPWLKTTSEVVSLLETKAFRNIDFSNFFQNALKSAASTIDAHSSFIPNYEEMSTALSGNFSGVGLNVISKGTDDDSMLIIDVIENSPSYQVGINSGDRIIAVDDEKIKGMSSSEVVSKMKGPRGSSVKIKILRNKKTIDFSVKRDVIEDSGSCCYHFNKQNIYYLGFNMFSENAPKQVENILEKVNQDPECKGIILDLRNNPGGILESGVEMANLFLPKNSSIVSTRDNKGNVVNSYSTKNEPVLKKDIFIFVLINNFTASAAEILSGALRYHSQILCSSSKPSKKARPMIFLAGTRTYGKGSVQEVIPLNNGCALSLTTMLYFLPDDSSVQAQGVSPDFIIQPKVAVGRDVRWIQELYGHEKSMKHHITKEEVDSVLNDNEMELSSEIDKKEMKKIQKLENIKEKEENDSSLMSSEKDIFSSCDVGDLLSKDLESIENREEKEICNKKLEKKKETGIAQDYQVQTCVNMISFLNSALKWTPESINTREKAIKYLRENFALDDKTKVKKVPIS